MTHIAAAVGCRLRILLVIIPEYKSFFEGENNRWGYRVEMLDPFSASILKVEADALKTGMDYEPLVIIYLISWMMPECTELMLYLLSTVPASGLLRLMSPN